MAKLIIHPQNGTIENSKSLKFEIQTSSLGQKLRARIENGTERIFCTLNGGEDIYAYFNDNSKCVEGLVDLNIPSDSYQSAISLFVFIEEKIDDNKYRVVDLGTAVYNITRSKQSKKEFDIFVNPTLITQDERTTIFVNGKPSSRANLFINGKKVSINTDTEGTGQISLFGRDICNDPLIKVIQKYQIKVDSSFIDSYISLAPDSIKTRGYITDAEIEQLKNSTDGVVLDGINSIYSLSSGCTEIDLRVSPLPLLVDSCSLIYRSDPDELPITDLGSPLTDQCLSQIAMSRLRNIGTISSAKMPTEQIFTAMCGQDMNETDADLSKINRVFVNISYPITCENFKYKLKSYPPVKGIIMPHSEEKCIFYFDIEMYSLIKNVYTYSESSDIPLYIRVLDNDQFGGKIFALPSRANAFPSVNTDYFLDDNISTAEYKRIVVDTPGTTVVSSSLGTKYQIIFGNPEVTNDVGFGFPLTKPYTDIADTGAIEKIYALPYIYHKGKYCPILNISVATNLYYYKKHDDNIVNYEYYYVYLIAQCVVDGDDQLFLYSLKCPSSWTGATNSIGGTGYDNSEVEESGWTLITTDGKNKNAKAIVDRYNTLHIFWESDRIGDGLYQVYYGSMGVNNILSNITATTSVFEKFVNIQNNGTDSFDYITENPYTFSAVAPTPVDLKVAIRSELNGGTVTKSDEYTAAISANVVDDQAMLWYSVYQDNNSTLFTSDFFSLSYQLNFKLKVNSISSIKTDTDDYTSVFYTTGINNEEILELFKNWFLTWGVNYNQYDETFSNIMELASADSINRFRLSNSGFIYDTIIPLVGSYSNPAILDIVDDSIGPYNDYDEQFEVVLGKDGSNVKDYFIGLCPERVVFKAENAETFETFCARNSYTIEEGMVAYRPEIIQTVYTGKYKLSVYIKKSNQYYYEKDKNCYEVFKEISEPFLLNSDVQFRVFMNYSRLFAETNSILNGLSYYSRYATNYYEPVDFVGSMIIFVEDKLQFAKSFISKFDNLYYGSTADPYSGYFSFEIGFGVPSGGYIRTGDLIPSSLNVFEPVNIDYSLSEISVGPGSFVVNSEFIKNNSTTSFITDTMIVNEGILTDAQYFSEYCDLLELGTSKSLMSEIPLTIEGINRSADVCLDWYNRLYYVWESNRDTYWNIYYSNMGLSVASMFSEDIKITNTDSQSLKPSISVNRNSGKIILWHDNRLGNKFQIFGAISMPNETSPESDMMFNLLQEVIDPYSTDDPYMPYNPNDPYDPYLGYYVPSEVVFSAVAGSGSESIGFTLDFYSDKTQLTLVKSISSIDNPYRWSYNGKQFGLNGAVLLDSYETATIVYDASRDIDLFGQLLYVNITIQEI